MNAAAETLRKPACRRSAARGNGDVGAHSESDLSSMRGDDATTEDDDLGGRHAVSAAEQNSASAMRTFKEMRRYLGRHAAAMVDIGASNGSFPAVSVTVS